MNYDEVQNLLAKLKIKRIDLEKVFQTSRCPKCVYYGNCKGVDWEGMRCNGYKRDPPDGGYYG